MINCISKIEKTTHMKNFTKQNNFTQKVKAYTTLAAAVVAGSYTAKAGGVTYTDVDPDETIGTGEQYSLDLNGDNVADFDIQLLSGTYTYQGFQVQYKLGAILAGSNKINFSTVFTYGTSTQAPKAYGPVVHPKGDTISANLDWKSGSSFALATKASLFGTPLVEFGEWAGESDKYAALQLVSGNNTYYGWVRLDMASDYSSITIKDYAYNSTSGNKLASGETDDLGGGGGSAVKEIVLKNVSVYGFQNKVNLNFLNGSSPQGSVTITNNLGQTIYSSVINKAHSQITIDEPAGNMYIVSVVTGEGVFTKKVFLRNN
jgi:hypothetical protein